LKEKEKRLRVKKDARRQLKRKMQVADSFLKDMTTLNGAV